jgi:YD repeat-containing protein
MAKRVLCVVVMVLLGQTLSSAAGDPGTVRWATKTGGNVPSGIAIGADGTAYATSSYYGYIGAVDPSGTRTWLLRLNNSYWESVSAPSIAADGTLYVRTNEVDALWAINPDGTVKWNIPFTSGHSPSIGADGTLYLSWGTGPDQELHALRPDGSTKWSFPTAGALVSAPSIGANGHIYLSCDADWPSQGDSLVYAIDQDGQEVWSVPLPGQIRTSPSIGADGTMYVATSDGIVHVIEGDGDLGWQYPAGGSISAAVAIADDGGLFFGASDGKLYALNADGSERWTYQAGDTVLGTPALGDDGSVYFSCRDQYVYGVDAGGSFLWKTYVTYWRLTNTLIGPNGDVYVVGENGYYHPHVYAINSATGAVAQAPWPVHRQNSRGTGRRRPIDMPPIELQLGESYDGVLPAGEVHHFSVDTEVDQSLLVEVVPGEGIDGLAVDAGLGQVSHPGGGDYSTMEATVKGSYELLISPTAEGNYVITVLGTRIVMGGGPYTVTARTVDRHLSDLTPRGGGNIGEVSVNISGLGFVAGIQVQLDGPGLPLITAEEVILLSGTELTARFDLDGAPTGLYDLVVTWPDASSLSVEEAFTVTPGTGPRLDAEFTAPEAVRPGRQYVAWIEYGNDGDTDMRAPLLFVTSPQNVKMRLSGDQPFSTGGVQILGISSDHPAGVLRPGEDHRLPIYFEAAFAESLDFEVERLKADSTPIDWEEVEDEIRPADISDELWAASWMNFKNAIGSTWRAYERALADTATYLSRYGNATYDASELFGVLFQRSMGSYVGEVHASSLDAFAGARGVPLFFSRVAFGGLYQRFTPGPLGRGWSHAFEYRATRTAADRVVMSGPGGSKRSFFVDADGCWRGMPGDFGRLEEIGGGALSLTEKSGLAMYFDAAGRLTRIDEPTGNGLSLGYVDSRLETISHDNGQSLTLEYNVDSRIQYLTDHALRVTEYVYDPSGELLEQVIAPGGVTTDYAYRLPSGGAGDYALVSVTHPDGTHTSYDHDSRGRMSSRWLDGGEERLDYGYDKFGTVEETDALDHVVTGRIGSKGELLEIENHLSEKLSLDYDANLNLTRLILPDGSRYRFEHDPLGNPIETSTPKGSVLRAGYTENPTRLEWFSDAREYPMAFEYENGSPQTVVRTPSRWCTTISESSRTSTGPTAPGSNWPTTRSTAPGPSPTKPEPPPSISTIAGSWISSRCRTADGTSTPRTTPRGGSGWRPTTASCCFTFLTTSAVWNPFRTARASRSSATTTMQSDASIARTGATARTRCTATIRPTGCCR